MTKPPLKLIRNIFLFFLIFQTSAGFGQENMNSFCGRIGTVAERVADCQKFREGVGRTEIQIHARKFELVMKDGSGELWRDQTTGLSWKASNRSVEMSDSTSTENNPCDGPYRPPQRKEIKDKPIKSFIEEAFPHVGAIEQRKMVFSEFRMEPIVNETDDLNIQTSVQKVSFHIRGLDSKASGEPVLLCVADLRKMILIDDLYGVDVRAPERDRESTVIVASRGLGKPGYELVLLASIADRNAVGINAKDLGFENLSGKSSIEHLNPQYLIVNTPAGPQEIFSFSLVRFWQGSHTRDEIVFKTQDGLESSDGQRHYLQLPKATEKGRLPNLLVNVPYAKMAAIKSGAIGTGIDLMSFVPYVGSVEILAKYIYHYLERRKTYDASKLSAILDNNGLYGSEPSSMEEISEMIHLAPLIYPALDLRFKSGDAQLLAALSTFNDQMLRDFTAKKMIKEMQAKDMNSSRLSTILGKYDGVKVKSVAGNRLSLVFVDLKKLNQIKSLLDRDRNEVIFTESDWRDLEKYATTHQVAQEESHWILFGLYDNKSSSDMPESTYKNSPNHIKSRVTGTELKKLAPQFISLLGMPMVTIGAKIASAVVGVILEVSANDTARDPSIASGEVAGILENSPIFSAEVLRYFAQSNESDEAKTKAAGVYVFQSVYHGLREHMMDLDMDMSQIEICDIKKQELCPENPAEAFTDEHWNQMGRLLSQMMNWIHHEEAASAGLVRNFEQNWVDKYRAWNALKTFLADKISVKKMLSRVQEMEVDIQNKAQKLELKLKAKETRAKNKKPTATSSKRSKS